MVLPATAVTWPVPPGQVLVTPFGVATVTPPGKVSVSAPVSVATLALALPSVMVSTLVPPGTMLAGSSVLATVGVLVTVSGALVAAALLPLLVCKAPARMVLVTVPAVLLVTLTVMTQELLAGMVLPLL